MLLPCPKVHAVFPRENLQVVHEPGARVRWDEHGGTFILRVTGLKVSEASPDVSAEGLLLEVALMEAPTLQEKIQEFAARHRLPLQPLLSPPAEFREQPLLAACHIPEKQLFIYCEGAELAANFTSGGNLGLHITGEFRARRIPCQEGDLIIHLDAAAMGRLLSYFYALASQDRE